MNWAEFFSMGGRGLYVWGSFGVFFLALAVEVALLRQRSRRLRAAQYETADYAKHACPESEIRP